MANTTAQGFPYPEDGDQIADEAAKVAELAEFVNDNVGLIKQGTVASGTLVAGTAKQVAVAFTTAYPVGTTPTVIACYTSTLGAIAIFLGVSDITRLGFNMNFRRDSGTASLDARWIAIGQAG